ncbi:MAG: hypothetical protein HY217_02430 [Candidatus Rokubacteria bacterium]|nr:hypothetical protein [Candidatus Rokubacteria bacterium]
MMGVRTVDSAVSARLAAVLLAAFVLSAGLMLALSLKCPTDLPAFACDVRPTEATSVDASSCSGVPPEGIGARLLASRTRMTAC